MCDAEKQTRKALKGKQRKWSQKDPRLLEKTHSLPALGSNWKEKKTFSEAAVTMGGDYLYHFVGGFGDSDKSSCWLGSPYPWNLLSMSCWEITCLFLVASKAEKNKQTKKKRISAL